MEATIYPTLHMNGTAGNVLLDALTAAMQAIASAIVALAETAPNGRDYYPQGPEAIGRAIGQYTSQRVRLEHIYAELETAAVHVNDQMTLAKGRQ